MTLGLVEYMLERQAATDRRRSGQARPWSEDSIIASSFLCSVVRDDDRTCREAIAIVSSHPEDMRLPLARCFRYLNHAETLADIILQGAMGSVAQILAVMEARRERGDKVLGAQAFKINVRGGVWSFPGIAEMVHGLYHNRWCVPQPTARETVRDLMGRRVGPFLAYQIMQDMRWAGAEYTDMDTWAWVGPGAARGLQRLAGTYGAPRTWQDRRFDNRKIAMQSVVMPPEMREVMVALLAEARAAGLQRMSLHEIEHNLCEWDKYSRIATGESKGRRFEPRS